MADTARSFSSLVSLFADNTSGDISPQDLRDLVETLRTHGGMSVADGASAQGSIGTSFTKVTAWDTDDPSDNITPDSTTDSKLTVPVDGNYQVVVALSLTGTASTEFTFALAVNGTEGDLQGLVSINATPDQVTVAIVGALTLSANDEITLSVKADGASKSITITDGQIHARLVG